MTIHKAAWTTGVVLAAAVGALGTPALMSLESAAAIIIALAFFGAGMGWAFAAEAQVIPVRAILNGAGVGALACLVPGFLVMVGYFGYVLLTVLVISAPSIWKRLERPLRGRILPTSTQLAGLAWREEALRRQWVESGTALRDSSEADDRLLWVQVRAEILDDLVTESGDDLPAYVWDALEGQDAPST